MTSHPLWHGGISSVEGGWTPAVRGHGLVRQIPAARDTPPADELLDSALDGAAAVILDWGSGGVYPSPQVCDTVARAAHRAAAWWIQDEVVSVFRSGRWFAFQAGEERPTAVTMGKGLTAAAVPGGALVLSEEAVSVLDDHRWQSVATFYGHPVSVAAVRATLEVVQRDRLVDRARDAGSLLAAGFARLARSHPSLSSASGEGLLWSVELDGDAAHHTAEWHGDGAAATIAEQVAEWALQSGVKVAPYDATSLWIAPPLVIEDDEIDWLLGGLDQALARADALVA